jgi:hypothetical protein
MWLISGVVSRLIVENLNMLLYVRNFGKCVSKIINVFGKDVGKFYYFKLSVVESNCLSVVNRFSVNSNYICYQGRITSKVCRHNDKGWSSSKNRLFFVSAGIFNLFGLKKDDAAEEPELITTIKRGILLTQVYIYPYFYVIMQYFTLAPANLRINTVVATECELWLVDNDSGSPRALLLTKKTK